MSDEPVFDANGWCSDMETAPHNVTVLLADPIWPWMKSTDERIRVGMASWGYRFDHGISNLSKDGHAVAWKPLGPGPVGT